MKRWIAADFSPSNTALKNSVPFKVQLERMKVLDIYRIQMQANFVVGVAEIAQFLFGVKALDIEPRATTLVDFAEEIRRRTWICIHHVRYTAPAEALTEEHTWDFVTPFTVWCSPTFQYMYTGTNTDMVNTWCEMHGRIRTATKKEWDRIVAEQRQIKDLPTSNSGSL